MKKHKRLLLTEDLCKTINHYTAIFKPFLETKTKQTGLKRPSSMNR